MNINRHTVHNRHTSFLPKIFVIYFVVLFLYSSCEPPEVGYLSDNIRALEDTVFVPRGVFMTSAPPSPEGSTYPLHWEIAEITDGNGNPTNTLLEKHEILTWTSSFNPNTDTTLALAEQKLELSEEPSLFINEVSGELIFTQSTKFVDNDIFLIDVNVSNVKGLRHLDDFVVVELEPFRPVEFPVEMRSRLQLGKGEGQYDIAYTSVIKNDFDDNVPSVLDGSHPYITVLKVDDKPDQAIKVRMIIADSYGNPLDPSKVIFYPSGSTYLQNFHDNSIDVNTTETATIFSLPAPPFPQFGRTYSGNNTYLMYYLTTTDAFTVDKEAFEADNGPKEWSEYIDPDTGEIRNRAYIRWGIKINDSGTWELKMKIPYTKIKK